MIPILEHAIQKLLWSAGFELRRRRDERSEARRLSLMLLEHAVDLVLDVGANTGQFAQSLRRAGYQGRLVSFEPLSIAHKQLVLAARHDDLWEAFPRVAVGDHEGDIDIHVSANSFSSSALDMLVKHEVAAPGSAYVGKERVRLSRLDVLAREYLEPTAVAYVKIDTQGYEDRVLDGMTGILDKIRGIQLELSFVPLYEGQQLFDSLVERLRALGFSIWAIWPGICDPESGRMLQVDAIFFRD